MAPAEYMQMEMIDGLPAVPSSTDYGSVAIFEALGPRDLRSCPKQVSQQRLIFLCYLSERRDVLSGDDQHVGRSSRINVQESVALFILIDGLGWDGAGSDFAKQAFHNGLVYMPSRGARVLDVRGEGAICREAGRSRL